MRIRTMAGIAVAGAAAAAAIVVGGVAVADDNEPTVKIVTEQGQPVENAAQQPEEDCPEKDGAAPEGTGL
jgi:hypothetical protein